MRKLLTTIVILCCVQIMTAQDVVRVAFKGASPTISDLAWALLQSMPEYDNMEDEVGANEAANAIKSAWSMKRNGESLPEGTSLTIDNKRGYMLYESADEEHLVRIELCYWNESDHKHKLVAYNVSCFSDGKCSPGQFDGIEFYRYTNATRTMTPCHNVGFSTQFYTEDGAYVSYALPRTGKDIVETVWYPSGPKQNVLKWTGRLFSR